MYPLSPRSRNAQNVSVTPSEPPKVMYFRHQTHQNMVKYMVSESQTTRVHDFGQVKWLSLTFWAGRAAKTWEWGHLKLQLSTKSERSKSICPITVSRKWCWKKQELVFYIGFTLFSFSTCNLSRCFDGRPAKVLYCCHLKHEFTVIYSVLGMPNSTFPYRVGSLIAILQLVEKAAGQHLWEARQEWLILFEASE